MRPSVFGFNRRLRQLGGHTLTSFCRLDNLFSGQKSNFSNHDIFNCLDLESSELLFYIHYSKHEEFDKYDLKTIRTLNSLNVPLVLISNSVIPLEIAEIPLLKSKNYGRDLGAMRDVLTYLFELEYSGKVIFLNNSMFWGPENDLKVFIHRILSSLSPGTFIGPVESFQVRRHFQSFLVALQIPKKQDSERNPLEYIRNWRAKRSLVRFGELPMLERFQHAGYKSISIVTSADVLSNLQYVGSSDSPHLKKLLEKNVDLNPTQHTWSVVNKLGIPGIKRSLVLSNPARIKNLPSIDMIAAWD